jgi:hypothetical protein
MLQIAGAVAAYFTILVQLHISVVLDDDVSPSVTVTTVS